LITKERRFSDRFQSTSLKLEICPFRWFGFNREKHPTLVTNFAVGGAAISTPLKLKVGQKLVVTILSEHHNIKQLPAEVVRYEGKEVDFHYGIRFSFHKIPDTASKNALFVLKQIEDTLRQNVLLN
jgi:hypothetical protein